MLDPKHRNKDVDVRLIYALKRGNSDEQDEELNLILGHEHNWLSEIILKPQSILNYFMSKVLWSCEQSARRKIHFYF